MSIQTKSYTSKRTGKTTTKHYAQVYNARTAKYEYGPYRLKESEAKVDEGKLIEAIQADTVIKRSAGKKLDAVAQLWLESISPPVYANSTWQGYLYYYNHYIKDIFGDKAVNKIAPTHVQRFINELIKVYKPETVNKILNILINIFEFAKAPLHEIIANPAKDVKRVTVKRQKKDVWTDDIVTYFMGLETIRNSNYYEMFCISLILGTRPGEVCGLTENSLKKTPTKHLEFERGYDRYGELTDMKTGGSHRTVPLPDTLYKAIQKKLRWKQKLRLKINGWGENDFLFVSENGNPIKPSQFGKAFKRLIEAHNKKLKEYEDEHKRLPNGHQYLPYIPLYNCRHTFASIAIRQCPNPALVASITGHSVKTLLSNYVQTDAALQAELLKNYASNKLKSEASSQII